MKENLCTKYFHLPIMMLPLMKTTYNEGKSLHIFCYRQS